MFLNQLFARRESKVFRELVTDVMAGDLSERGFSVVPDQQVPGMIVWTRESEGRSVRVEAQTHRYDGPGMKTFTVNLHTSDSPMVRLGGLIHGHDYWYEVYVSDPDECWEEFAADWQSMGLRWLDAAGSQATLADFYDDIGDHNSGLQLNPTDHRLNLATQEILSRGLWTGDPRTLFNDLDTLRAIMLATNQFPPIGPLFERSRFGQGFDLNDDVLVELQEQVSALIGTVRTRQLGLHGGLHELIHYLGGRLEIPTDGFADPVDPFDQVVD